MFVIPLSANILLCSLVAQVFSTNPISVPVQHVNDSTTSTGVPLKTPWKYVHVGSSIFNGTHSGFYCEIQVGSDGEKFKVKIDTGSSEFWLPSGKCLHCKDLNRFHCHLSKTCKELGETKNVTFMDTYARGHVVKDNVTISGIVVENTEILAVNFVNNSRLRDVEYDGILGLAIPNGDKRSILSQMREQKLLKRNIFAYHISKDGTKGVLTFGNFEEGRVLTPMYPIKIRPPGTTKWRFNIDEITFGPELLVCSKKNNCAAIADTGSPLIHGPKKMVDNIYKYISTKTEILANTFVPCSSIAALPNLSFNVNGRKYTLTPEMYSFSLTSARRMCMVGLYGAEIDEWVLGNLFLKNFYTIHDFENMTITFANLREIQPMILAYHNVSTWHNSSHWHNSSGHYHPGQNGWNYNHGSPPRRGHNVAVNLTPCGIVVIIAMFHLLFYVNTD